VILHQQTLRTIHDTLSLTNSTLLTAENAIILWCTKILFPVDDFRFVFLKKNYILLILPCPPLSRLTSCTFIKSNLYLANNLAAPAVSEHALYRFLTFQVPNLKSLFSCLYGTSVSVQVGGLPCKYFVKLHVFTVRSC
jgi:hypothetical protein